MKKERIIASKKMKTITKPKTVTDLGEDLPIFSGISNVDLENLKGAEATCVKIATEMKKCSRLKEMSNFNVL